MPRSFDGDKLVFASHNPGKLRELDDLLRPYAIHCVSAGALGLEEPEETGATFAENAELKALAAATGANLPALADDSGLAVAALDGEPGIYSARWAGAERDFNVAMATVRDKLQAAGASAPAQRRAHFVSALTLAWPDGHCETFVGTVHGTLVWPPRGSEGFGYDPMFLPDGESETFGEMAPARKHAMSHRAVAFQKLLDGCFKDRRAAPNAASN